MAFTSLDIELIQTIVSILAGTIAAVAGSWRAWPTIRKLKNRLASKMFGYHKLKDSVDGLTLLIKGHIADEETRMNSVADDVTLIKGHVFPNHGNSLSDAVSNILSMVTDVKQSQVFIRSFMKTQLNAHAKAIFLTDHDGACTWVSRPHSRLTGFSPAECMGTGWINVIAPEERDNVLEKWNARIESESDFDETMTYIKPDGKTRYPVHVQAYKIYDGDQTFGYIGEVSLV